jgi:putative oxidoreductase
MKDNLKAMLLGGPGSSTLLGDIGLAILRLGVGLLMAFGHGLGKLWDEHGFGPPQRFIEGVGNLHFPAPTFFAWCAALAEFLGAILLAVGLCTRPVALILSFNMAVAAFGTHLRDPIVTQGGRSKEMALLYLLPFLLFALIGAGRVSLDHMLRGKRP